MHERVKIINKYYTNLEYDKNNKKINETLEKIFFLFKELNFKKTDKISHRFFHTASLIEKHLNLFKSVCEHVDIITSVLNYLYHFGASFLLDLSFDGYTSPVMLIMLTIYSMCLENVIQVFLETAIVPEDEMEIYQDYKNVLLQHFEMILLEDSDLYAVIDCLKFKSVTSGLHKIWVQESIVQTFKWHFKKYFGHLDIPIHIFQSKEELLIDRSFKCHIDIINEMNIVSIWSEDVIAAKNLAESLNQHILFINTHMDFCPGIIFPYIDLNFKSLYQSLNLSQLDEHTYTNLINPINHKGLTYNLFYNGMWQIPIKYTYWIHNNILLANATREDVMKCSASATIGFTTWNIMSSKSRMKILSNFASTLECNGKFLLASTVSNWIKLSYIRGSLVQCYQNERFEVIKTRKPQGTVILMEKDEITLFRELTQSLIIGNSVIVICNPDLCILAPYCDMFKISGIPSGVINLLSSENTDFRYDTINNNSTVNVIYDALTIVKHIIIPHK
ncbi:hypothetical protein ACS0PU_007804 [Formica fusca]